MRNYMKDYPKPAATANFQLNEAALAADLEFPVARGFDSSHCQVDPQLMLRRISETMRWRSTRPGAEERRLAEKISNEFVL
jgi:hypothetical protein